MAFKLIPFVFMLAVVSQTWSRNVENFAEIEEIRLDDRIINHLTNPLIGFGISIPQLPLDTLEACTVNFPTGLTYEVYPHSNLPTSVSTGNGVFRACDVLFQDPSITMSGVYELTALSTHHDGSRTVQRQRFDVRIEEIEP